MITGPRGMPVFNDSMITPEQKRDMIAYIVGVREEPNPARRPVSAASARSRRVWWPGSSGSASSPWAAIWITRRGAQPND
ncbi:hypothetical protein [Streptosporangium vulgare]|uniref:hypothetical protein n=1 Tax=Streptosporangium vulgare TaxID=46190 RepID=UPI0031E09FC3